MKNQLQNWGKWMPLLLALLLTGGTTMKAQTWAYFPEDKELFKDGAILKNVTVKEGTQKDLVIGNNSDLTLTTLDMTGTIASGYIVTEIGKEAFSGTKLTSFICSDELTVIGESAFSNCSKLTSITFNDKLAEIGLNAFNQATSLLSVTFPKSLTTISSGAFRDCSILTTVNIPEDNQINKLDDSAFTHCEKLTSFTIPAGITKIEDGVFSFSGLTSITLPATITEISANAFSFCTSLTRIDCKQTTEPVIGTDAFSGDLSNRTVYALKATTADWDKTKWGASEIIYSNSTGITNNNQVGIWVDNGMLQVISSVPEQIKIFSIDGVSRYIGVVSGNTQIALPEGMSIVMVGNRKFKVAK